MGVDIADINNDAGPDISVCDMVPATHHRRNIHISQALLTALSRKKFEAPFSTAVILYR